MQQIEFPSSKENNTSTSTASTTTAATATAVPTFTTTTGSTSVTQEKTGGKEQYQTVAKQEQYTIENRVFIGQTCIPSQINKKQKEETCNEACKDDNVCRIACINCRQSHRKCDKVLSGCSYCNKTRKQCVYREPKKRSITSKSCATSSDDFPVSSTACSKRKLERDKDGQKRVKNDVEACKYQFCHMITSNQSPMNPNFCSMQMNIKQKAPLSQSTIPGMTNGDPYPLSMINNEIQTSCHALARPNDNAVLPLYSPQEYLPNLQHANLQSYGYIQQSMIGNNQTDELLILIKQLELTNLMEYYFSLLGTEIPVISPAMFNETIQMFYSEGANFHNMNSSKLLIMSTLTWCLQKNGKKDLAHRLYLIFNKYIWSYMLTLLSNFKQEPAVDPFTNNNIIKECTNLTSALATMAYYAAAAEGEHVTLIFRDKVSYLSDLLINKSGYEEGHRTLINTYLAIIDMTLYQHSDRLKWIRAVKELLTTYYGPLNPIIHIDYSNSTGQLNLLEEAQKAIETKLNQKAPCMPSLAIASYRLSFRIAFDGMRLQVLQDQENVSTSSLIFLADRMMEFVRNNDAIFPHISTIALRGIPQAAHIHLQYGTGKGDLYDILSNDLYYLRLLGDKFDVIPQKYANLIQYMEHVLSQKRVEQPKIISSDNSTHGSSNCTPSCSSSTDSLYVHARSTNCYQNLKDATNNMKFENPVTRDATNK
jgi:hypothetical protein